MHGRNCRSAAAHVHFHIHVHRHFLQLEWKSPEVDLLYFIVAFPDRNELTGSYILKGLYDTGSGPFYDQLIDLLRLSDANLLSERRGAEAAARIHVPVNHTFDAVVRKTDDNMSADSRAIGTHALQFNAYPVIVVLSRVKIEGIVKCVSLIGAAGLYEDILDPVILQVDDSHAMTFLQIAHPGGTGDIGEMIAADILEQAVRRQGLEIRVARA